MTKLYEDVYISELRGALQRITNDFTIDEAGAFTQWPFCWVIIAAQNVEING